MDDVAFHHAGKLGKLFPVTLFSGENFCCDCKLSYFG